MQATVDAAGRLLVPKALRDAVGIRPGSTVDLTRYGAGLHLTPHGRTARVVHENGRPVAVSDTVIDDNDVAALIDSGRRWSCGMQVSRAEPSTTR